MVYRYVKKPITIEAIQWEGDNQRDISDFIGKELALKDDKIIISTLEGMMEASIGDFIIKGIKGEFYPCKADIFHETYNPLW